MRAIGSRKPTVIGEQGREDRRYAFHLGPKPHVVVPFVVDLERLDAIGNRVLGQLAEIAIPVRIDRPIGFEVAADPIQEASPRRPLRDFDGVVNTNNTDAFFGQGIDLLQVGQLTMWPPPPSQYVTMQSAPSKAFSSVSPTVLNHGRFDVRHAGMQRVGKQHATGIVLVRSITMAGLAGDEHNFLLGTFNSSALFAFSHAFTCFSLTIAPQKPKTRCPKAARTTKEHMPLRARKVNDATPSR